MTLSDLLGLAVYVLGVTAGYQGIRWRQLTTAVKQLPIGTTYTVSVGRSKYPL